MRKIYPVKEDCAFLNKRYKRCDALKELDCAKLGKCKFYKSEEQYEEELKKYPWVKE